MPPATLAALMLAAGYSRRYGSDKRISRLANGQTLLATSLDLPCDLFKDVWVVVRPDDDLAALDLPRTVHVVQHPRTTQGMGHSIGIGVARLLPTCKADALAIFLADMPAIQPGTLRTLMAKADRQHIIVPTHGGLRGHPVIFGEKFWPELCKLQGDQGARSVLQEHPGDIVKVEVDDPGILFDIDTPNGGA